MPVSEQWLWTIRTVVSVAGLGLGGLGAWRAYWRPSSGRWKLINTLVWSIGPPLWFVTEYTILYPWLDNDPSHKEDLRHGQGLAKAFWAGIGALLVALYKKAENDDNKAEIDRQKAEADRQSKWNSRTDELLTQVEATVSKCNESTAQIGVAVGVCDERVARIVQSVDRLMSAFRAEPRSAPDRAAHVGSGMLEWVVPVTGKALEELQAFLMHGPFLDDEGTVAVQALNEHEVARINGLKIEVFSDEHPPPHFRVKKGNDSNCYTIADCTPLYKGLDEYHRNIKKWHKKHKQTLIDAWDETRPTDCPVGKFGQPASQPKTDDMASAGKK